MDKRIPVKDHPGLAKDPVSGAIININKSEAQQARERKKAQLKEKERIDNMERDLKEIKSLLQELVGKN